MIKRISTLLLLRILFIVLQLLFIKILTKGLNQAELGFYYFHLAVTLFYQVIFFTPFIVNYQRKFISINKQYNVVQYLNSNSFIILFYLVFFFLISLFLVYKLSILNILLFCIYSFLIFRSTIYNTYLALSNKTSLVYIISISELIFRNLILFILIKQLNLTTIIFIIIVVNYLIYTTYSKIYLKSVKINNYYSSNFKLQFFKAILFFMYRSAPLCTLQFPLDF